jgi:hypothetical protein
MLRSRILIPLAAVLAIGVAAPAGASTYCVNNPSCVAAGGTDKGNDATALASALSAAQVASGRDRVEVGAGAYEHAGGYKYSGGVGNELDLAGAGSGQTVLTNTTTGTTLSVTAPDSAVTGFGIVLPPAAPASGLSLAGANSVGKDIAVATQATSTSGTGAIVGGGATLSGAKLTGAAKSFQYGVVGTGRLEDSTVDHANLAVYGPTEIHRVAISGSTIGIYGNGTAYKVDQVLIQVPAGNRGIAAASLPVTDATVTVDHATIVGTGDMNSVGVAAQASSGGAAHNARVIVRSSIVRGTGHSLQLYAGNGNANIEVDHSDLDQSTLLNQIQAGWSGGVTDNGGNVNVDPQFVSASDFHLPAGSPVVDQGAAALQAGESSTDFDGAARLAGAATDMGAFEYQPPAPPPPPAGQGGTEASGGETATDAGTPSDVAPADTPPADTPAAQMPPSDPPVVPVKHKRTCAQIAKAKRGKKARAKAKARCLRKHRRTHLVTR